MAKFFMGLLVGLLLCGAGYFAFVPSIKQTSYQNGFDDGSKKGVAAGMQTGIAQGISEIKAQQAQQKDSLALVAERRQQADHKAMVLAAKKTHKKVIQNWHVIDGKISAPIED